MTSHLTAPIHNLKADLEHPISAENRQIAKVRGKVISGELDPAKDGQKVMNDRDVQALNKMGGAGGEGGAEPEKKGWLPSIPLVGKGKGGNHTKVEEEKK